MRHVRLVGGVVVVVAGSVGVVRGGGCGRFGWGRAWWWLWQASPESWLRCRCGMQSGSRGLADRCPAADHGRLPLPHPARSSPVRSAPYPLDVVAAVASRRRLAGVSLLAVGTCVAEDPLVVLACRRVVGQSRQRGDQELPGSPSVMRTINSVDMPGGLPYFSSWVDYAATKRNGDGSKMASEVDVAGHRLYGRCSG